MSSENPITAMISSLSETYAYREESMKRRVAETSVMAQKMVDERHGSIKSDRWWQKTKTPNNFNNLYIAGSMFKGKDEGCINSFKAARYYSAEAGRRREELLKEIAAEEESASN
mmetsp:Transcript_14984/g.18989  ORF Transcript_14984/g.18989 Transcript_14984/m.18989 type:complete len:114 (-) Transcript_14984:333-674(-)|eukprot:CAMPEP_0203672338 /NCGR_PEP_ID=MMETSP0090-20130426/8223_1 /ASSEMBLY_ACC=CAM_ASM_001088 /TAXON_ID=426623 /ORGANISM="Chaetoceros affinis, Strain CCMP159" /LENGTH=113 /DNA_ID=CAMNT_0050537641 /DNA_START=56 /DNA_END=397 /DNA_ORIENTATION=+